MKKIAWVLRVPEGARVMVKNGNKVSWGEVIYELEKGNIVRLPLKGWKYLRVEEKGEIKKRVVDRKLIKNEVLWSRGLGGLCKLRSPWSGKCLEIDDLGMMIFSDGTGNKYCSPIACHKVRVEKGRIVYDLRGWEKEAEGISGVKGWGEFKGVWIRNLTEMSSDIENQVIVAEGDDAIVAKAEALGIKGIIMVNKEVETDFREAGVPIVKMEKKEAEDIIKLSRESIKSRVWLNPLSGKVLLVLE